MVDVYHATVHDLAQAALQSLFYLNYFRGGPLGIGPNKCEMQLHHASRVGNSNLVVKVLDRVDVEARVNKFFTLKERRYLVLPSGNLIFLQVTTTTLTITIK